MRLWLVQPGRWIAAANRQGHHDHPTDRGEFLAIADDEETASRMALQYAHHRVITVWVATAGNVLPRGCAWTEGPAPICECGHALGSHDPSPHLSCRIWRCACVAFVEGPAK